MALASTNERGAARLLPGTRRRRGALAAHAEVGAEARASRSGRRTVRIARSSSARSRAGGVPTESRCCPTRAASVLGQRGAAGERIVGPISTARGDHAYLVRPCPDRRDPRALTGYDRAREVTPSDTLVALVLREGRAQGAEILFIERAEKEGDPWSGHMAFPGGRVDSSGESPEQAAVRETLEEVGLSLAGGERLGRLDDLEGRHAGRASGMVISAFVYHLPEPGALVRQEARCGGVLGRCGRWSSRPAGAPRSTAPGASSSQASWSAARPARGRG
jgi:8-oxo-dGTP pyrophosphatase MutT (NUDIX family)